MLDFMCFTTNSPESWLALVHAVSSTFCFVCIFRAQTFAVCLQHVESGCHLQATQNRSRTREVIGHVPSRGMLGQTNVIRYAMPHFKVCLFLRKASEGAKTLARSTFSQGTFLFQHSVCRSFYTLQVSHMEGDAFRLVRCDDDEVLDMELARDVKRHISLTSLYRVCMPRPRWEVGEDGTHAERRGKEGLSVAGFLRVAFQEIV